MRAVKISNGMLAVVDDSDFDRVNSRNWYFDDVGYARTNEWRDGRKSAAPRMHRFILNDIPANLHIDHINGNKLDNRRSNLRVCTASQNASNRGAQSNNSTGFKGVCYDKARGRFKAEIAYGGKRKHIGRFDTALEAAQAYNDAALKYHGEFAFLNNLKGA